MLTLMSLLTQPPLWLAAIPVLLIISILVGYLVRRRMRRFSHMSKGYYLSGHPSFQSWGHQEVWGNYQRLKKGLRQSAVENGQEKLQHDYMAITTSLVRLLEARDHYTRGHSDRVRYYCHKIGCHLGLSQEELIVLDQAAQLHDLGKIGIPDHILHKPGTLTPAEWAEVELHPERTVELLRLFPFLEKALPLILSHHERWNGKGYSNGLSGENIPLGARIIAAADTYDAMTSERPYRRAMSHEEAIEELRKGKGISWDEKVVEALIRILTEEHPPDNRR